MKLKAYAKINISLDVIGKREDDYHLLEMIMQSIDLYDIINIEKNKDIIITSNKHYVPTDEKNLCYKAAKLFMDTYSLNQGVKINIEKNIPVSAGLAGGSTDAAAVLCGMKTLFNLDIKDEELQALGLKIGADVPFCLVGGTALCEGIGEKITKIKSFKDKILVLVKPPFSVSTKEVYTQLNLSLLHKHPNTKKIISAIENDDLNCVSYLMKNVLENVTIKKYRSIKTIKNEFIKLGALNSMMSGSGPTVFAFYDDMFKAQNAYDKMKQDYNEVYITRTI